MEKVVPTALSERQKEHEDGGEKPTLTTLASKKEDLATLEHPQAEESVAAFLKDANPSLENEALSGMSKEGWNVLKEAVPGSSEKVEAMDREGKVNDGMHSRKASPCFLSPFTHQEADDALEACDVADEPHHSRGVVSITGRRKKSYRKTEDRLKFRKGCYKADLRRTTDEKSPAVLWDCYTPETMGSVSKEESTLERLPGLKDSVSSQEVALQNSSYPKETTSAMESNIIKTVQMNTGKLEGEAEHLDPGKAAAAASPPYAGAQPVSGDERYHSNEPKQLEAFSKEHIERGPELDKKGFQRYEWLSEHNEGLGPPHRSINKPAHVATNLSVRGQSTRDAALLALPVFRKMLNPHPSKAKTVENALFFRKGRAWDSDLDEVSFC
ncbi:hypothetical protein JRQ81_002321 [Phrynocephalus forsythii]|uniref:Uncharacterized protein n=1 Tax=Phrynocephalus forsythii TaxID=171643 RepID=A0A9Q0XHP1_9SAUR|nr:hypothetical protein JRQ81_002321 [Phrynocephalus forsythii]